MRSQKRQRLNNNDKFTIYIRIRMFVMRTNAVMTWQVNYCFIHPLDRLALYQICASKFIISAFFFSSHDITP